MNKRFYFRDQNGVTYLWLDLRHKGDRLRTSTGIQAEPDRWNEKDKRIKGSGKAIALLNSKIGKIEQAIDTFVLNNDGLPLSMDLLKLEIEKAVDPTKNIAVNPLAKNKDFTDNILYFLQTFVKTNPDNLKPSTIEAYNEEQTYLEGFAKKYDESVLLFENINVDWHEKYINYLYKEWNHSINTADKHIKCVLALTRRALGKGYHTNRDFELIKRKTVDSDSIALTEAELVEMYNLDLSNVVIRGKIEKGLERTRDVFVFAAFSGGMRRGDQSSYIKDSWQGGNFIKIITEKTDQSLTIPLRKIAKEILIKYNGDIPKTSDGKFNSRLKEIAQKIASLKRMEIIRTSKGGIIKKETKPAYEMVSSHSARRSWCTNGVLLKIPTSLLMAVSGHKKESQFWKYVKIKQRQNAEALMDIYNKIDQAV